MRIRARFRGALVWALVSLAAPACAFAADGGKKATKLVNVADTRDMRPGVSRWIADVYNSDLWLYGLIVAGIMAGMGLVLGLGFDKLIGLLGINLGKLEHHE